MIMFLKKHLTRLQQQKALSSSPRPGFNEQKASLWTMCDLKELQTWNLKFLFLFHGWNGSPMESIDY